MPVLILCGMLDHSKCYHCTCTGARVDWLNVPINCIVYQVVTYVLHSCTKMTHTPKCMYTVHGNIAANLKLRVLLIYIIIHTNMHVASRTYIILCYTYMYMYNMQT